jgi:hypothetical protein
VYLFCIWIYIFLKENRRILCRHDDMVTSPCLQRTEHARHTASCLRRTLRQDALGRISERLCFEAMERDDSGDGEVARARECSPRLTKGRGASAVATCRSKLRTARTARRSPPAPRKKEWRWGRWLGAKGPRTLAAASTWERTYE